MLIASCTSYPPRIANLPKVIDSLLGNTCPPDKVIINLSKDEFPDLILPIAVHAYIDTNEKVIVNWVDGNWKVYKKFLPILKYHPNDLILSFDDDTIYPKDIIEDLLSVHEKYPDAPIATNHFWFDGLKCHCGECSLTQAKHFKGWEQYVNDEMIAKCPADDLFYTNLAAINGYFYKQTDTNYPAIWEKYEENNGYSKSIAGINKFTEAALFPVLGKHIKTFFTEEKKPLCLLNVVAVPRGLRIEGEMLSWLTPIYNVIVIEHDGSKFEYVGLKYLQDYINLHHINEPVLYIHSKGAVMVRAVSKKVHKLWKWEFGHNYQKYLDLVDTKKPTMATPYAGITDNPRPGYDGKYPVPWYNGWIANADAIKKMNVHESDDRYVYETCIYQGIEIIGTRCNDISWTPEGLSKKDSDLNTNF